MIVDKLFMFKKEDKLSVYTTVLTNVENNQPRI